MSTSTMKALRFSEFGPPSVLRFEEIAIPEPGEGEALVRVKAAAINPSDTGNVAGHFKHTTLPRTRGPDFAGVIVNVKGDAGRTADAIISAADFAKPALRLTPGSTAYDSVSDDLARRLAAIEAQRDVAFSADRDSG